VRAETPQKRLRAPAAGVIPALARTVASERRHRDREGLPSPIRHHLANLRVRAFFAAGAAITVATYSIRAPHEITVAEVLRA